MMHKCDNPACPGAHLYPDGKCKPMPKILPTNDVSRYLKFSPCEERDWPSCPSPEDESSVET